MGKSLRLDIGSFFKLYPNNIRITSNYVLPSPMNVCITNMSLQNLSTRLFFFYSDLKVKMSVYTIYNA